LNIQTTIVEIKLLCFILFSLTVKWVLSVSFSFLVVIPQYKDSTIVEISD